MKTVADTADGGFRSALRTAQLSAIFDLGYTTYSVNLFVSITVVVIYISMDGWADRVVLWLGINALVVSGRSLLQLKLADREPMPVDPLLGLNLMTASAFVGGLVWALLPAMIPALDIAGRHNYVVLIVAGASMGSMVRGTPHSPVASAFALPPLGALAIAFVENGTVQADILAMNMLILAFILYKSCRLGAANFLATVTARLEATDLAASLQLANADIRENNRVLELLANCDPLTGLANRGRLHGQVRFSLASARPDETVALFILDLDRFKQINDTLGHAAGDTLLNEVARRLTLSLGGHGLAARLGGDEFAVLITGRETVADLMDMAHHCLDMVCQPLLLHGKLVPVRASLGMAAAPHHTQTAEDLFAYADQALYESKKARQMQAVSFDGEMKIKLERQRQIEQDLRDAIIKGELKAWFQPQVRISDGHVLGFEALVRWNHPELGFINPQEVVRSTEILHQTKALARSMAEQGCQLLNDLSRRGLSHSSTVSINISPRDFALFDVREMLCAVTDLHGVARGRLEVELTEEAELEPELIQGALQQISQAGFKLALDDFGMGHTSLTYLLSLKVDRMKIDRSFVHGIAGHLQNQALVSAMVALGRMLGIDILVEGVEEPDDLKTLRQLGCQSAQGYYFGKAMPHEALIRWLEDRVGGVAASRVRP